MEDPASSPSQGAHPSTSPLPLLLPPEKHYLYLSLSLLSSKDPSFTSVTCVLTPCLSQLTFYPRDFLNKLSLRVWVLALNSFLARTQVPRLLNWGLVWLHWSNAWCCFCCHQHSGSLIFMIYTAVYVCAAIGLTVKLDRKKPKSKLLSEYKKHTFIFVQLDTHFISISFVFFS